MPAKRKMQQEREKLRKLGKQNRQLMQRAAIKAEDMIALGEQYEELKRGMGVRRFRKKAS